MSEPTPNTGETPAAAASTPAGATAVTAVPPGAAAVTAVPTPPKPAPVTPKPAPAKPAAKGKERRFFLLAIFGSWFAIAWVTFSAAMLGMILGTVRFLFPNVLAEPPSKFKVGFPDQYEDGKVVERFKDQNAWIVRYQGTIYALSTTCT